MDKPPYQSESDDGIAVSIVLPVYNEHDNLGRLYRELTDVLQGLGKKYEIIGVDDGSKDGSYAVLTELSCQDSRFRTIRLQRNYGQTAALSAGIGAARGDVIIPMDADLQNDPHDIPRFLAEIEAGCVVVSGWRKERHDRLFSRRIPSLIANKLIVFITGVHIHDYGCTLKAYKRDVIQGVNLYGEMHRFIAAYASWHGGRVGEIIVNHRPRLHGKTNYGISRTFKVLLDLIVVKFLSKYLNRPMHFFGGIGIVSFLLGVVAALTAIVLKLADVRDFVATPLPVFSALLIIVGVQLTIMGIIAEMIMRVYYESQAKKPYLIKETINFDV